MTRSGFVGVPALIVLWGCAHERAPAPVADGRHAAVQPRHVAAPSEPRPEHPLEAARFRYEQRLSADGTVPDQALLKALAQLKQMRTAQGPLAGRADGFVRWSWLGPGNIGGRLRAILIHPTQPEIMWVGSAGGGIWKTTDAGASWTPLDDFLASLSIGCMALDPADPDVLYAGTGEGFFDAPEGTSNTAAIRGAGIFRSVDGGQTWSHLPSTDSPDWYFVNRLAINPADPTVILAATGAGIFRTTDAGATWTQVMSVRTLDVKFDPADPDNAIAGRDDGTAHYSTDGGVTWQPASGLSGGTRVELRYAPGRTSTVYAAVADAGRLRVWRSLDGGRSYTRRTSGNGISTLASYTGVIWVHPTRPDTILLGGQALARSTDAGATLNTTFTSVHADHHVIIEHPAFNGTTNRVVYFGTDGGIYRADDADGSSAVALNNNLGVTQFYGAAMNPDTGVLVGGTQDNGTLRFTGGTQTWTRTFGGDGGYAAADPTDPNYFYGEVQRAFIFRSTNAGRTASYIYGGPNPIQDAGDLTVNFIPHFILDPNDPDTMLVAARRLWRSRNVKAAQPDWFAIKPSIEPAPGPDAPPGDHYQQNSPWNISTIAVAQGDPDVIWVGYNNGQVWNTFDGTSDAPTWTRVDANGGGLPARWVSRIVIDPHDHARVYVALMGWEPDNVWRTDDAGQTWTRITGDDPDESLPDVPVGALAAHPRIRGWLFAGTDPGIFASPDDGRSWTPSTVGPGTVPIDELVWRDDDTLLAVTHGRGVYSGDVGPFAGDVNCDAAVDAADIEGFILALFDPAGYAQRYPDCDINLADMNGDGLVNSGDIEGFIEALFGT